MEYLVAVILTLSFFIFYVATKRKPREPFTTLLSDDDYIKKCNVTAVNFGAPKENGKCTYDAKPFYKAIKKAEKLTLKSKIKEIREFQPYFSALKKTAKRDFEKLADLPCKEDKTRVEIIARTALENSEYMLIEGKIASVFDAFNKISTVTFPEIEEMKNAFRYVYLEKAGYIASRLLTFEKIRKISLKISKNPKRYENSKLYARMKDNNVFLYYSALERGEKIPSAEAVYFDVLRSSEKILSNIADGINLLDAFSFYRFYRPLEILYRYDLFVEAEESAKKGFLLDLSEQSTKINIDEYCFALVIDNYLKRAVPPAMSAKKINLGFGTIFAFYRKKDLMTLLGALTSRDVMSLYYDEPLKRDASILKNVKFKNTLVPFTQEKTLKFGISIGNDKFTLTPSIPSEFEKVELDFTYKNVPHHVTILPSSAKSLSINGTFMKGVPAVKLGNIPLAIELKTPFQTIDN